jgi:hypothetical protein
MTVGGTETSSVDFRFSTEDDYAGGRARVVERDAPAQHRGGMHFEYIGYGDVEITPSSPPFQHPPRQMAFEDTAEAKEYPQVFTPAEYIRAYTRPRDDPPPPIRSPPSAPTTHSQRIVSAPPRAYCAPERTTPERPLFRGRAVTAPTSPVRFNVFPPMSPQASVTSPRGIPLMDLSSERSVFDDDDDDDDNKRGESGSLRHLSKLSSRLCMPLPRKQPTEPSRFFQGASDFFCGLISCGSRRRH